MEPQQRYEAIAGLREQIVGMSQCPLILRTWGADRDFSANARVLLCPQNMNPTPEVIVTRNREGWYEAVLYDAVNGCVPGTLCAFGPRCITIPLALHGLLEVLAEALRDIGHAGERHYVPMEDVAGGRVKSSLIPRPPLGGW